MRTGRKPLRAVCQSSRDFPRNLLIYFCSMEATEVVTGCSICAAVLVRLINRVVAGQTVPSQRTATIDTPTATSTGMG